MLFSDKPIYLQYGVPGTSWFIASWRSYIYQKYQKSSPVDGCEIRITRVEGDVHPVIHFWLVGGFNQSLWKMMEFVNGKD